MRGSPRRRQAAAALRLRVAVAAAVVALAVAGCGPASTEVLPEQPDAPDAPDAPADPAPATDAAPATTRPPLSDPPDPGPAPEHHGLAPEELAAAVESSVRVTGPGCRAIVREGSGFAVGDGDLVVTVAHLLVGLSEPAVELADGRVLEAVPVAIDRANDLAVLRVDGAGLAPLALTEAVPDGTVGAILAWEAEGEPDPTPFRIDRPITARTDAVAGEDRVERPSWLLAAAIELGRLRGGAGRAG